MTDRPFAEYAARNAAPILEILRREYRGKTDVLEIGSGTGQHAVMFAGAMEHLRWQTSDLDENHPGICAWINSMGCANVLPPLAMDVRDASVQPRAYDAAFSSNTAHIMSTDAVEKMFSLLGKALRPGGVFCLYGPFRQGGAFNTRSNAAFDRSLRERDAAMGIRDIETLDDLAATAGLKRVRLYAVPSNNNVAVWIRSDMR